MGVKKHLSEEHRKKIGLANSIANKGYMPWIFGKHHSEETKKKISEMFKNKLKINIDKDKLYDLYINKKMTAKNVSKAFNCSESCIVDRLIYYKIKQRTKSESKLNYLNPMFGKHPHNYNKKAEYYEPIRRGSIKQRITIIRLYKEGKLIGPNKGKKSSDETKHKSSESHKEYIKNNPNECIRLKELRKRIIMPMKDSSIEIKIQNYLKELRILYETHKYMDDIEHSYQCDIFIPSFNLIIECDGDYWHNYPYGKEIDYIRTNELKEKGYNVLRLWENNINKINLNEFNNILMRF